MRLVPNMGAIRITSLLWWTAKRAAHGITGTRLVPMVSVVCFSSIRKASGRMRRGTDPTSKLIWRHNSLRPDAPMRGFVQSSGGKGKPRQGDAGNGLEGRARKGQGRIGTVRHGAERRERCGSQRFAKVRVGRKRLGGHGELRYGIAGIATERREGQDSGRQGSFRMGALRRDWNA